MGDFLADGVHGNALNHAQAKPEGVAEQEKRDAETRKLLGVPTPTEISEISLRLMPANKQESAQMDQEQARMRLPKDAKEWAEVEALAAQGPGAVYGWIYGQESLWRKKMIPFSWQDLQMGDPIAGCHQMVESRQKIREILAKYHPEDQGQEATPAPVPAPGY